MAAGTITTKDGNGNSLLIPAEVNAGASTPHSVPEVAAAAVSLTNPMPVLQPAVITSTTLSATSTANAVAITTSGYGTLSLTMTGLTASAATVTFTASDNSGTSYYSVVAIGGVLNTRYTTATTDGSYQFSVAARTNIKIAVTTTGTGTITLAYCLDEAVRTVTIDSSATSVVYVADASVVTALTNRMTVTATSVAVAATTSTLLIAANANRKSLRISGSTSSDAFRIGYGVAASATSSALFGASGIALYDSYGPGSGVPTNAIYAYAAAAFTAQILEGN